MNSDIKIRKATPADAADIQKIIVNASWAAYEQLGFSQPEFIAKFRDSLFPDNVARYAEHMKTVGDNELYLVADSDEQIVGCAYIEKTMTQNVLHAMYVLPEFQRKGVATLLWNEVQKSFDATKPAAVSVIRENTSAIAFYKNLGFVNSGKQSIREEMKGSEKVSIVENEMVREADA